MSIHIQQAEFALGKQRLKVNELNVEPHQFWTVVGGNGSGKTAFSAMLAGELDLTSGSFLSKFCKVARSSFELQQQIIGAIFKARNNDTVDPDDFGLTAKEVMIDQTGKVALAEQFAEILGITKLLDRPFMQLSTGESRKVLLCQTLVTEPDLLILDEPLQGLDGLNRQLVK